MLPTAEERPDAFIARGPEETERAGREIARQLRPGDVVLLRGGVGAGKSTLVRAALRELGVSGSIPSPTFTIGRGYSGSAPWLEVASDPLPVSHLDLYRLESIEEEDPGLLAEYFGPDRIAFIEWPEGAENYIAGLAARVLEVEIAHRDESSRTVRASWIRPPG